MDLPKVCDCSPLDLIIRKLYAYGFVSTSLKLFLSHLFSRKQRVKIGSPINEWIDILIGILQFYSWSSHIQYFY